MARKEYSDIAVETTLASNLAINGTSILLTSATGWPTGATYDFVLKIDDELILCDARSGTTVTVASGGRGYSGTTAIAHTTPAAITHVWDASSATDFARHVYDTTADDHTQYQKESEKAQAGGYASLDGSALVPDAQIPAAIARDSEVTAAVAAHAAVTTSVHGIADTSLLATKAYADALVDDLSGVSSAATARTNLGLGTAAVKDTGTTGTLVVISNDARLSDTRTPTDNTVSTAKIVDAAVTTVKILDANVTTAKLAANAATFAKIAAENRPTVVQQSLAGTGIDSTATIGTVTITDPGYDIYVWGSIVVAGLTSAVANYVLSAKVKGATKSALVVPFISATISQSAGVPIKRTLAATGSDTVVLAQMARWVSASGQFDVTVDDAFSYMEVWWVRAS